MKTLEGQLSVVALAVGALGIAFAQPAAQPKREITLTSRSVPLSATDDQVKVTGDLLYLGGLWLKAEDKGFGGLSGLIAENAKDGLNLIAISDNGDKFSGHLVIENGRPSAVDGATLEPLFNESGQPVTGKAFGDSESVVRLPDGRVLVGFERNHRIWSYGPALTGPAKAFDTPALLNKAPTNGGLESIASWPDGRVLAITEQLKADDGNLIAFLYQGGTWTTLEWKPSAPSYEPSDATVLPNGDLLILERYWTATAPTKLASRIMRIKGDSVKPGAILQGEAIGELTPPLIADNFEGITSFTNAAGKTQLLLLSDDNFNNIQRTLLLSFELLK